MKRRDFITRSIIAGTAAGLGYSCKPTSESNTDANSMRAPEASFAGMRTYTEPAREIPVFEECDVLVIGGGPAGTAAAISASRAGARTCLVERYNHLGGLWTGGLVLPLLSTHAVDKRGTRKQVIYGIGGEMADRLRKLGMAIYEVNPVVDPEAAKYVLDEMISESGVIMYYHTWASDVIMDGITIKGVIAESKSGRIALLAKVVIDCTGDGDIFHLAGEKYDIMNYHIGLVHRLGNVDKISGTVAKENRLNIGSPTPLKGVNWVNMHGLDDQDGTDVRTLSKLQLQYRKEIWESVSRIRSTPGCEDVFLLDTASQMGVRMSRMVEGEYKLTLEDTMTFRSFSDVIGISGAWTTMLYKGRKVAPDARPYWQIPYRSLVPKTTDNLLVAGRCFCFERDLVEDTRIIGTCLVNGHGAGAAAALAVKENVPARSVTIPRLKKLLVEQGAWLG